MTSAYFKATVLLAFASVSAACSRSPKWEVVKPELEVVRSEDEEARRISNYPTAIRVLSSEAPMKWQRVEVFAEQFLGTKATYVFQNRAGATPASALVMKTPNYVFSVRKELSGKDFVFVVTCEPATGKGTKEKGLRNARNLARFIEEGKLEVALLDK